MRTRSGVATPMDGLSHAAELVIARRRTHWLAGSAVALVVPWLLLALPGPQSPRTYVVAALCAVLSLWVALAVHRPSPAWPWLLLGAGLATRLTGLVVYQAAPHVVLLPGAPLTVTQAIRILSFPLLVAGLIGIVGRGGGYRSHRIVDGLAIAYSLGSVLYLLFVVPYLHGEAKDERWIAFAFVMGDLSLLGMAVMVFTVSIRNTTQLLLGLASLMFLVGDLLRSVTGGQPTGVVATGAPGAIVLIGYFLMAVAAWHPSVVERRPPVDGQQPTGRLKMALLGLTVFVYPAYAVLASVNQWVLDPLIDVGPPVTITTLFCFYLAVRSAGQARDSYRREQEQAAQAAALGAALAEQQALQGQLTYRALHDPLTGLANRAKLTEALDRVLADAALPPSDDKSYALLLIDLDGFKDVNDTHGHPVGDELLVQAAARFSATLPDGALLARLGGDEFAVLIGETDEEAALAVGRRLTEALRTAFHIAAHDLYLTTSVGLYVGTGTATPSDVLRNADLALYAAKGAGKDQVVPYRQELRTAHLDKVELLAGLRRAVANGEFVLEYQPVVDLVTERISSVEALLRWDMPDQGRMSPADFVPIAEESGLIVPIGAWVLSQACVDAADWYARFGISVAVNVATAQLRDPEFVSTVIGALRFSGLPPEALVLEITESTMIAATAAETDAVVARLEQLRGRGIRIAIDDFGTGYSSLSYLRRLPVDILKIDRAFSMDGPDGADSEDTALTKAILQLSHSLGLSTVAEGVETSERADTLRELRCDRAQGFLYSKPVGAGALDSLLAAETASSA
ncbi:putative bifunctional diguanylate cyclase/phosphodiesterase [Cryptosporangium sp. NPDC048952]|uniref:putative bifunctional diguanylate cyclase/phosphodiesterase n=1 Tax=Cryptosporangium sp. NPDC048952 TaxID=3363961 RepID=UPI00371FB2F1